MDRSSILEELNKIVSEVVNSPVELTEESTSNDIEGWDSLAHINIILSIESFYRLTFSTTETLGMANVKELIDIILSKTNG